MKEGKLIELLFISFMLMPGVVAALNCTSPTPKSLLKALQKDLFPYKHIRPVNSFSNATVITLDVTVVGILDVNEISQTLTIVIREVLEWDIYGLSWDEKECGTNRLTILRDNIWVPDVQIAEFMEEDKSPRTPYVYLSNTGHVFDDKPVRVTSSCQLDIYTFPFDIQNCSITFGSYIHFSTDIRMVQGTPAEEVLKESRDVIRTNGEWELADIQIAPARLLVEEGNYSEIHYFIILRRKPLLYVVNLLIPSCFLVTVDIFSFMLPPHSVDRASFKMTLILGYTVFLLIMNDLLPVTGNNTPLINAFFSISLALMVTSLLETVFITHIQLSSNHSAVPEWLSVLVLRYIAVIVCLPQKKSKTKPVTVFLNPSATEPRVTANIISSRVRQRVTDGSPPEKPPPDPVVDELRKLSRDLTAIRLQVDAHFQSSSAAQEWEMIGKVVDRFLFGLYIVFITVTIITIMSIWIWNNSYAV